MDWDWNFVWEIMPTLIRGVKITILATLLGSVLAAIVGLGIALARRSPSKALSRSVGWAAEFIRGTPLLVQLYFIFYVLPDFGVASVYIRTKLQAAIDIREGGLIHHKYRHGLW